MRILVPLVAVVTTVVAMVALTWAYPNPDPNGAYAINFHFVPAILKGNCSVASIWVPPNVRCTSCFCITGSVSRCVPMPGCNPILPSNSTSTTPNPNSSSSSMAPADPVGTQSTSTTPAPATPTATTPTTTTPSTVAPTAAPGRRRLL